MFSQAATLSAKWVTLGAHSSVVLFLWPSTVLMSVEVNGRMADLALLIKVCNAELTEEEMAGSCQQTD